MNACDHAWRLRQYASMDEGLGDRHRASRLRNAAERIEFLEAEVTRLKRARVVPTAFRAAG